MYCTLYMVPLRCSRTNLYSIPCGCTLYTSDRLQTCTAQLYLYEIERQTLRVHRALDSGVFDHSISMYRVLVAQVFPVVQHNTQAGARVRCKDIVSCNTCVKLYFVWCIIHLRPSRTYVVANPMLPVVPPNEILEYQLTPGRTTGRSIQVAWYSILVQECSWMFLSAMSNLLF